MREGLRLYDENEGIRSFCATFSMSRYQYAHEYCLMVYRGSPAITITSDNTNRALSSMEMATVFAKGSL